MRSAMARLDKPSHNKSNTSHWRGVSCGVRFHDEATGTTKPFDKPMYAVVNYGGKAITTNITPLTNLAASVAGVDTTNQEKTILTVPAGKTPAEAVKEANAKVAQKFGLNEADLTSADVQTTNQDKANAYGRALAIVSQMENNGVDIVQTYKNDLTRNTNTLGTNIQTAVTALKTNAANSDNPYLKNIDTDQLDTMSVNADDVTEPKLVTSGTKANTSTNGKEVYLHFDSELSKITADRSAFTLNIGGKDLDATAINSVGVDGKDLVLKLNKAIELGEIVKVSYTDPTESNDLQAVQDVAGNDVLETIYQVQVVNIVNNTDDIKITVLPVNPEFSYPENQVFKGDFAAKVQTTANRTTVTKFRFVDTFNNSNSSTSPDGWYSIDDQGHISLTNAGLGTAKISNDFESFFRNIKKKYYVKAGDDLGNWSDPVLVTMKLTNVSEAPTATLTSLNPTFTEAEGIGKQAAAVMLFKDTNVSTVDGDEKITSISLTVSGLKDDAGDSYGSSAIDYIHQFKVKSSPTAVNFDKLDISALLQGFNAQTPSNLSDWITNITVAKLSAYDTSNTTTLTIAVNGLDDPDDDPDKYVWIKQEIMLEQVDIFSGLNLAPDASLSAQLAALKTAGILIA